MTPKKAWEDIKDYILMAGFDRSKYLKTSNYT